MTAIGPQANSGDVRFPPLLGVERTSIGQPFMGIRPSHASRAATGVPAVLVIGGSHTSS